MRPTGRDFRAVRRFIKALFDSLLYHDGVVGRSFACPVRERYVVDTGRKLTATMDGSENRQIARDSLFVMADLRLEGLDTEYRIKVRNLSAGGMMGEGSVRVTRGAIVFVNMRNIGWIEGSVAWVQENRFGVAFREEIDPREARASTASADNPLLIARPPVAQGTGGTVRKI